MTDYESNFIKKYQKARDEKNSILCAGFDPAISDQRENNVIPGRYFKDKSIEEGMLEFFEEFLESVHENCCAIKPNNQYIFHFSLDAYQKMNRMIHEQGLVSILDQKLGDIGSTNDSGFYWMNKMGFDAVTFSPFAGNIAESITSAHKVGMGLIALTLMSNPEAIYFMKNAQIEGKSGYEFIAQKIGELKGDGLVVGATGHVTELDIQKIRKLAGNDPVMLIPGIGKQQGDLNKVIVHGGKNILLNVSRDILYSNNIKEAAIRYNNQFNNVRMGK
ncbi:MAG TPA: orotidine 5'-phosphate decarboxylase / HUMPS family protein [Candidatus Bathyarchaeia archaeon]|nr:orotidine 5'-phosphate decarboxylase / HUMPS family protein [Candidatus Bathyarchaeia archaeon]